MILYESGPCLVVDKPAGLATQAPPGIDSLESRIKALLAVRDGKSGNVYLGVPHRLDRPVSGAIVFALDRRTARRLARQFEARSVKKTYWACVEGAVEPPQGTWRDAVRKIPDRPQAEVVDASHPDGRPAVLHYRTLGTHDWGAWLEIELETGRMHQIRIQSASRGLPVLGDRQYGSMHSFGTHSDDERRRAIALHARTIEFDHPTTRERIAVKAPLPETWIDLRLPTISPPPIV